ncbi:MAG TPA: hypothetical protein VFM18_19370 [Methanosarcina sp.]|nr:hypothetical protein [Methanosarcina sp.]
MTTPHDIRALINLLEGNADEIRDKIATRVEKIPDPNDLTDILKFANRYSIKKDVEKFATLRQYKDMVSSVFLQALADANVPETDVKKFLKKLSTDGILNEKTLMTPRKVHSYLDLIDPQFRQIFDLIKIDLFQKIAGKIGEMGDVGKGEYMLDIISPTVNRRGAPGDLDIDGVKIELKAGESGRIGPSGSLSLVGRFPIEFLPTIKKLVPKKVNQIGDPTDFNPKLNMTYFSDFFETPENIKTALTAMLKMHYPTYNVSTIVNKVVDSRGNINGDELKKEMLKASFTVYKKSKGFDGIIIMDYAVTKFLYISSPEDIAAVSDSLKVKFPSWTDKQSDSIKVTLTAASGASTSEPSSATSKTTKAAEKLAQKKATSKIADIAAGKSTSTLRPKRSAASASTPAASAPRARRK